MPRDQIGETRAALKFTRICKYWQTKGRCHLGDLCTYAHSYDELRIQPDLAATALCTRFKRKGFCKNGNACRYAHGQSELRRLPDTSRVYHETPKQQEEIEPAMFHYMMAQRMAHAHIANSPVLTVETKSHTVLPNSMAASAGPAGADSKLQDEPEFLKAMMRDLIFEEPEQNSPRYAPPVADKNVCPMWVTQTEMVTLPAVSHVGEYFA
ncbi:ZFP36L1 [Symbiodinium sp. CCMP2456]|nr:ZFP36L1 [Symbiodinium sp. CCMP2456]